MEDNIPKAIYESEITIGTLKLKVAILDNGQRIIEEQSMIDFLEWLVSGELNSGVVTQEQINELTKFVKQK